MHYIESIEKGDRIQTKDAKECAVTLKEYFRSVYTIKGTGNMPVFSKQLPHITINEDIVLKKLTNVCVGNSWGPDDIIPWILKYRRKALYQPLTLIYSIDNPWNLENSLKFRLILMLNQFLRMVSRI